MQVICYTQGKEIGTFNIQGNAQERNQDATTQVEIAQGVERLLHSYLHTPFDLEGSQVLGAQCEVWEVYLPNLDETIRVLVDFED